MSGKTNQGRWIDTVLDDVSLDDLSAVSQTVWIEARRHGSEASCECPVIEALAHLYELGYKLTRDSDDPEALPIERLDLVTARVVNQLHRYKPDWAPIGIRTVGDLRRLFQENPGEPLADVKGLGFGSTELLRDSLRRWDEQHPREDRRPLERPSTAFEERPPGNVYPLPDGSLVEEDLRGTDLEHAQTFEAGGVTMACADHREVQHRDGKPPWCNTCGWTRGTEARPAERLGEPR